MYSEYVWIMLYFSDVKVCVLLNKLHIMDEISLIRTIMDNYRFLAGIEMQSTKHTF